MGSDTTNDGSGDWMAKFMFVVRLATAASGIALFGAMLFSIFYYVVTFSLTCLIISIYLTPVGMIIFVVEWRKYFYPKVIEYFPFLQYTMGRALLYLFVAGQCLALESTWGYVLGAFFLAVGAFGLFYAFTKEKKTSANGARTEDVGTGQPNPQTMSSPAPTYPQHESQPGSKSLTDSMGAAVGAAALDWAQKNPQQAQAAANYAFNTARENPEMVQSIATASTSGTSKASV